MLVTVDVYSSLSRKALAYFTATYGEQSSHRLTEWQDTIDGAAHLSEKARALEANLSLEAFADGAVSAGVVVDWVAVAAVVVAIAVVLALTIAGAARSIRRLDHAMMLREGNR